MSTSDNKAIVEKIAGEIYSQGNLSLIDDVFAPDALYYDPLTPEEGLGREEYKQFLVGVQSIFPDMKVTIEEMIAEGDVVTSRWSWSATHRGELFGVAPTGNLVTDSGLNLIRFRDGKVVEIREAPNALGVMIQLGLVPEMDAVFA